MAEALLQVLIENLASLMKEEIGMIMGVDKEMKKISDTLFTIQKVLEDAEDQQFQSKAIQNWLSKLSDIAHEIEDILDECVTEVSKFKMRQGIRKYNFVKKILYSHKIGRRMKEVAVKLDAIAADRRNFHLSESQFVVKSSLIDWRRETGSIVNEPDHIYGRDEDKKKIVDVLLNQVPNCDHQLSVMPIIGMGGLGKTTLAQLVYNDERVSQKFDTKLWVCVSDEFDLMILIKAMIESATGSAPTSERLDALQRRLQELLNGKKYLLILDDVWNEDREDWDRLRSILASCGSKGSSIIVTTRSHEVGDIMGTLPAYCLEELLEEHCWSLFKLKAFGHEDEQHRHPNLEDIGRQIVKKCAGVPLAAKALGGLLYKKEEKEWIRVNKSDIWNLSETKENSILRVLRLSYRHLPVVLKRCFVYCAVFPKDRVINKQDLIFRWMAHGCISSSANNEVEDVGEQVWKELVLRSFFQQVDTRWGQTTFKMHDLVHDLAQSIMQNNIPGAESNTSVSNTKIREVHVNPYSSTHQTCSLSITLQVFALTTIVNYNRLRFLTLCHEEEELPSEIGKLKHLRLIDLSYSSIHSLPSTFCGLWNLQTLILTNCRRLESLPKKMRSMINLRHILLGGCRSLNEMPSGIRALASLKTLNYFIVSDKIDNQLDELQYLNLGGKLKIKHLERISNLSNAKKSNLVGKPNLVELVLKWERERTSSESANMMDDEKVLEALEPHPNLRSLKISGFKGGQFPLWMKRMENLTEIEIECSPHCYLPRVGVLPRLHTLILRDVAALEYIIGDDEIGVQNLIFPSLKVLKLYSLPNVKGLLKKETGDQIIFPNLQTQHISNCESMILPPLSLSALEKLTVWNCSPLTLSSFFNYKLENVSYLELGLGESPNTLYIIREDTFQGFYKDFDIHYATEQQHFPLKWFQGLKSLVELVLYGYKIGSCFPEKWLRHLTALEELRICWCSELVEMGEEIRYLSLRKVDEMVSLPQGLQHIPTLQSLSLSELQQLTSLPEWLGNLTSLTSLTIDDCPKLASLPSTIKGMKNLNSLYIWKCPELERRCEKEKGEDWHIIAHIPQLS